MFCRCSTASPVTAVLALFEEPETEVIASATGTGRSSLHDLASLPRADQIAAEAWLKRQAVLCRVKESYGSAGAVYLRDRGGNTVGLVGYHARLLDS